MQTKHFLQLQLHLKTFNWWNTSWLLFWSSPVTGNAMCSDSTVLVHQKCVYRVIQWWFSAFVDGRPVLNISESSFIHSVSVMEQDGTVFWEAFWEKAPNIMCGNLNSAAEWPGVFQLTGWCEEHAGRQSCSSALSFKIALIRGIDANWHAVLTSVSRVLLIDVCVCVELTVKQLTSVFLRHLINMIVWVTGLYVS